MIEKWETIKKEKVADYKIFSLDIVTRKRISENIEHNFVVLDSPKWVNVIPVTKSGNIVLIEQFRQGTEEIELEIPAGLVEKDEAPEKAAIRECLEETGYESKSDLILIGENKPNPAYQNNICYSYAWFDCELKHKQNLDGTEEINVFEVPKEEIKQLILDGKIQHSIVLTAFFFFSLKYGL